jgi:chromosome segregation ATPase
MPRVAVLEARKYDTKPMWEQALAETNAKMEQGFESLHTRMDGFDSLQRSFESRMDGFTSLQTSFESRMDGFDSLHTTLESKMEQGFESLRTDFESGMESLRNDVRANLEHEIRGVGRKIDALNHNVLELQGDQRYVERRLAELESQIKPT